MIFINNHPLEKKNRATNAITEKHGINDITNSLQEIICDCAKRLTGKFNNIPKWLF